MDSSKNKRIVLWDIIPFTKINIPGGMSVELVHTCPEVWPSDKTADHIIAAAARTSFNNFKLEKTNNDDERLIKRLLVDAHTSPFEMATLTFLIKAPKFVMNQLLRHRSFRFNEESQRYHQVKEGYFHPSDDKKRFVRAQDKKNKQSSIVDVETSNKLENTVEKIENKLEEIFDLYNEAIELGMARECARFCLPSSTWSNIVVQCDLNNMMKFLRLRLAKDAQYEIQLIARGIYLLAKQVFPITMNIFDDVILNRDTMSLETTDFKFCYTSDLNI